MNNTDTHERGGGFAVMSHPERRAEMREEQETQAADLAKTLLGLGAKIEVQRKLRSPAPSERQWVKNWPGLGSAKTWGRVLRGDLEGMDIAARIPSYRAVLSTLTAEIAMKGAEDLYTDLASAEKVTLEALRLMHHEGKDRLILIEGGSGSGKTSCLDLLEKGEAAGAMRRVEGNEAWKSLRVAMGDILRAYGYGGDKRSIPASTGERMDLLIEVIGRSGKTILAIDEAHHATGAVLNLIKTLLNRTGVLIILAGMSTLFRKLRITASEEAKQLIHNRLFARIVLGTPNSDDVRTFIARRLGAEGGWKPSTLKAISESAANAGHWSFVRRLVDHLQTHGIAAPDDAELMGARETALMEIAA